MFGLGHMDVGPLLYGIVIFIGLLSMWSKLMSCRFLLFAAEAFVFWLVFALHGGTMTGGMSATVASLLAGIYLQVMGGRR